METIHFTFNDSSRMLYHKSDTVTGEFVKRDIYNGFIIGAIILMIAKWKKAVNSTSGV
jgi:hypothetical protein